MGRNVRAEMARADVSQSTLASMIGLSQPAISKRLRGEVPFDINEAHLIAKALSVDVARLLPKPEVVAS